MPINPSDVPDVWVPETPSGRTLEELQRAVGAGDCMIQVSRETWTYETTLQSMWNWMRTTAIGHGIDRNYSTGTAFEHTSHVPLKRRLESNE